MEELDDVIPNVHDCPSLNVTKAIICVLLAAFVVYLPLGEPADMLSKQQQQQPFKIKNKISIDKFPADTALGCICDFYNNYFIKFAKKTSEVLYVVACIGMDILYESKIMFYKVLETLDGDDLCNTVCCPHIPNGDGDQFNEKSSVKQGLRKCCRISFCPTTDK